MQNRETRVFQWDNQIYEDPTYRRQADPIIDERTTLIRSLVERFAALTPQRELEILELGVGSGYTSYQLKQRFPGAKITGVDLSDYAGKVFSDHEIGQYVQADVTSSELVSALKGRRFDLIISAEVIEHLVFPADLIKNIDTLLAEGGHCILTTPFHGFLKNLLILLTGNFESHFDVEWDHIRFFSVKSLTRIIRKNSQLKVVDVVKYGRFFPIYRGMMVVLAK